jgi:hypothetical protein
LGHNLYSFSPSSHTPISLIFSGEHVLLSTHPHEYTSKATKFPFPSSFSHIHAMAKTMPWLNLAHHMQHETCLEKTFFTRNSLRRDSYGKINEDSLERGKVFLMKNYSYERTSNLTLFPDEFSFSSSSN